MKGSAMTFQTVASTSCMYSDPENFHQYSRIQAFSLTIMFPEFPVQKMNSSFIIRLH